MSETKKLRDYQELCISQIGEEIKKGHRAICFVLATGLGKSLIIAEICRRHIAKVPDAKILIVAHRTELIGQLYDEMVERGLLCGVIQANPVREANQWRPVQIASIQTLLARKMDVEGVTLMIVDEAHHIPSRSWVEIPNYYKSKGALVLGATATPVRADGLGLGEVYDALVQPISMKEAIRLGHLVPFDLIRPDHQLESGQIAAKPVDAYLAHAKGRQTAVYAMHIKAANHFRDEFLEAGITCGVVTGAMPYHERSRVLSDYADGHLRVIVSVGTLTEGWNDPPTSCVILARSVGSVSLFLQALGRALRLSHGKKSAVFLDLHGASWTHGSPDDDRDWCLEGDALRKTTLPPIAERFCAVCGILIEMDAPICPGCGIVKPELTTPEVVNARLVKFAAKIAEGPEKRAATLARWIDEAVAAKQKVGKAAFRYKGTYGAFPTSEIQRLAADIRRRQSTPAID